MKADRLQDRSSQWLQVVGRLRDGVSQQAAAAEIDAIGTHLRSAYPATNKDRGFYVERAGQVHPGFRNLIRLFFLVLLGVTVLVLLTACANVANLLLARASSREKEIATRLAIGAGRGRVVRQLLTESLILAALGGAGGYAVAQTGVRALARARVPLSLPVDLSMSLDYRVTLFCIALSLLTGVAFGLAPALRATRPDLVSALKERRTNGTTGRRVTLRDALVVGQVTVCTVLLICCGLFLRSLQAARNIDPGFAHRNVLLLAFDPGLNGYRPERVRALLDAVTDRVAALPGVQAVALTSSVPLNMEGTQNAFVPAEGEDSVSADIYSVSPRFFETLGIPFLSGEDFRPGGAGEDIVVVNQAVADKAYGGENPTGRRIRYLGRSVRIAGMVATTKSRTIGEEPRPALYFSLLRELRGNDSLSGMTLLVRTSGDPGGYTAVVRQTMRDIDPELALFEVRTMEAQISRALYAPRAAAALFGIAGIVGLIIATVGLYGVISFLVARRTKEIGIRMALGARKVEVLAMVMWRGVAVTTAGCAAGLALALAVSRATASLLYGIHPSDGVTFVGAIVLLHVTAVIACLVPARRAASVDPVGTLRCE
jgi:predicted permease